MDKISSEEYATAVAACVNLAQQVAGSSRIMAQVLLSACNGDVFQLNVVDLCDLDEENYAHALAVIRGRYELRREPREMFPGGSQVFRDLWDKWSHLELTERAKKRCPDCSGGKIYENSDDEVGVICSRCSGTGRVCECK